MLQITLIIIYLKQVKFIPNICNICKFITIKNKKYI